MERDFGKYKLLEKIGTGGMAEVYLAKSFGAEGLEKILVIKRILPDYSQNARFVEMFISEAKIAMDLNHPNIVQIYDFGKHEGDYFLAMEYVEGADLGYVLAAAGRAGRPITVGHGVFVATEIAKGLHYAHAKTDRFGAPLNIVHRDISPQNVLVSVDGTVKIVDFGIAKATSVADANPHLVKGKFSYMSPEQASGKPVDCRSDVFALGVMLFELVTGRSLFQHGSQDEVMSMVKSAVVPDIKSLNPDIPPELAEIIYRSLAKSPDDRHQTARDLQVDLTRVLYSLGEIHDSTSLSHLFSEVERHIDPSQSEGYARTQTTMNTHTSKMRTVTGGGAATRVQTPVTRIVDESDIQREMHSRERKEVAIVAGELVGLFDLRTTLSQDKWFQILQEYTRIVDAVAFKHDAVVHRVNEDGFMILFGLPVSSENDAELAVRVALDLHEAVSAMNHSLDYKIQLSVGIAMGSVMLEQEVDKTGRHFSWSFLGAGNELAERLAHAAMAKEVLIGGQVYRRVRREYDFDEVERVEYPDENTAEAVQAYLLTSLKSGRDKLSELRQSFHTFRGRELPLKALRDAYRETVLESRAQAVLIVGRQGLGKSTLVEQFLRGLDQRNVRIVRGVTAPYHRDVPLGSMASFLADILRLGDRDDLRHVRNTLDMRVSALFPDEDEPERQLLLQSIGAIFNIKWPDGRFHDFTGDERRDRIFLSLRKLLVRFAEKKPIILAMEDAQHIDTMTLEFIAEFFSSTRPAPAFVVFTADEAGPHSESKEWAAVTSAKWVHVEELDDLGPVESEALVRDLLRLHRIDDENLVAEILRRSGGNPLYIREVVEVLRDRGLLVAGGAALSGAIEGDAQWLPSSVEGLIRARIDRLPLNLKVVLQRVAFLWSTFSGADVGLVLPDEPFDELEELVVLGLLEREDATESASMDTFDPLQKPPHERRYRFCNQLTQEVAAGGTLPDEAIGLHQRLADHLLQHGGGQNSAAAALIARHFDGAGDRERSVEFYFHAADEALESFGAAESLRLCDRVLERVDPTSHFHYQTLKIRARALAELGLKVDCGRTLDELEQIAFEGDEPAEQAEILIRQARFLFDQSELRKARDYAKRARDLAAAHDDPLHEADGWLIEATITLNEGNRDQALEIATRAAQTFAESEEPFAREGYVRSLNLVGVVHRQAGRHEDALEAYEEAIEVAVDANLRKWRRNLLNNAGLALAYLGEFSLALERYNEALEQARRLGHLSEEANLMINIGHCRLLLGQYDRAQGAIRRGNYLSRKTGETQSLADGLVSMGAVLVEMGDYKKAADTLHEGLRLADSIPHVYLSVHATLLLARVNLGAGTGDAARIALMQAEDAVERSEQAEMKWGMGYGYCLMARAKQILGKRDEAVELSKKAVELVNEGEVFGQEEILYHHTQILPDEPEHEDERRQAIMRARELIIHRRDKITDDEVRKTYMAKAMNRKIFNVADLILN